MSDNDRYNYGLTQQQVMAQRFYNLPSPPQDVWSLAKQRVEELEKIIPELEANILSKREELKKLKRMIAIMETEDQ